MIKNVLRGLAAAALVVLPLAAAPPAHAAELAYDVLVDVRLVQDLGGRGEHVDEPAGPYGRRNVAQRGTEGRPGPLAHREAFGELSFCVLRYPPPGLVLGKERDRVLAYGSAERDRRHVLLNDAAPGTARRPHTGAGPPPLCAAIGESLNGLSARRYALTGDRRTLHRVEL